MTGEEKRYYARGYNRGAAGRWPEHRPPAPPDAYVARLLQQVRELRDAADTVCSTLCEDDEFVVILGAKIDAIDAELSRWSHWIRNGDAEEGGG